jgi:hypothetical protein
MVVQKQEGCDHITCYCSYEFCYLCGGGFPNHVCPPSKKLNGFFDTMRVELDRPDSPVNAIVNCGNLAERLEPDIDRSKMCRYMYILLLTLLVYPVLAGGTLAISIVFTGCWFTLAAAVLAIFVFFRPIFELKNLQLPASKYFLGKSYPQWLVRLLVLPLYPLNLWHSVCSIS